MAEGISESAVDELNALLDLRGPSPEERRRIAELVELLFDVDTAWVWWERAAEAGDPDAWDYLMELVKEENAS
ncbi:hypothetical protein ABZ916_25785 [Streptomyces sp. NPDC046853]|uniref:hypothetical protein n=1 Tax=Streptomyces sp. NPDC046853 TaxID=3154920 RepID=UPI003410FAB0